jgi:mono/diheme cytochrome c family protein
MSGQTYLNVFLVGCAFFVCLFMTASQAAAAGKGLSPADLARLDTGRDIYHINCAACHGFDGNPILMGVPNFAKEERMEKGDKDLLKSINNGKEAKPPVPAMPPWKGTLSADEQKAVLKYVRVIKGDTVFQENCTACHGSRVPPLADSIPKTVKKLKQYGGTFQLCKGLHAEEMLERPDIVAVIKLMLVLPEK